MAPRNYDTTLRLQKQAELKTRIAAAAAELHAARGVNGTSYAQIAEKAGVSLPTVYAHFPTQDDLLNGCTAHVGSTAPKVSADTILAAPDLARAADLLTRAIEERHAYFEPWLAWREDRVIPFLSRMADRRRDELTHLIARIVRQHLGPGEHRETVAGWESTLSFDFWHRLVRGHRLSRPAVRRVIVRCLLALTTQTTPNQKGEKA